MFSLSIGVYKYSSLNNLLQLRTYRRYPISLHLFSLYLKQGPTLGHIKYKYFQMELIRTSDVVSFIIKKILFVLVEFVHLSFLKNLLIAIRFNLIVSASCLSIFP